MARIRTIKPEFWTSLTIHKLTHDARLTFIGLWNYADDEGRAVDDPRLVKAAVWPLDEEVGPDDVHRHLDEIAAVGLVDRYQANGTEYLQIRAWTEHQTINRPGQSRYPAPSGSSPLQLTDDSLPEQGTGKGTGNREQGKNIAQSFERFWSAYPRKQEKKGARDKFAVLVRSGTDPEAIIAGAERYRDDPNRDALYTKHPTTWLNRGCWEDAPLPTRHSGKTLDRMAADLMRGGGNGSAGSRPGAPAARQLPGALAQ